MLMVFKYAPFCFSSPLFSNQPIMSPRDSMCQEKMAKKALMVHKYAHISSSLCTAKSLFLLIGALLFFHFPSLNLHISHHMSYSCIMGVKEAKVRWQQLPS
jgi:hypothetical protein